MITIEDFKKLEIRIATIESVDRIEGADKLLKLSLNVGDHKRQILAGIAEFISDPQSLIGKQIPILINLEPRKMRGEVSEGMMLAADENGTPILLHPERHIADGSIIR
jgi:methionine--tRNA ligase beta chain